MDMDGADAVVASHNGGGYLAPHDLEITHRAVKKILVVGSCMAAAWLPRVRARGIECDYILTNNSAPLPHEPPSSVDQYDLQIVQLPLRSVFHENAYSHLAYDDIDAHTRIIDLAKITISNYIREALRYNIEGALLTFVCGFLVPQQNPVGRTLERYDIRNPAYVVEMLNVHLDSELKRLSNVYFLDLDRVASAIGKMHLLDDSVTAISHGSILEDEAEADQYRINPPKRISYYYNGVSGAADKFYETAWREVEAAFRTIRQIDQVKIVIFDLDDTLWRGVVAEGDDIGPEVYEGWPVGLMEAICFLKRRGIILALASKNDEETIERLFPQIVGGRISLSYFAIRKINWKSKPENVVEILNEANIGAKNALFVDDNPIEREAVQQAIPGIRVLGTHLYYLRRILLWSPEIQVPYITDESTRRGEMIEAQIEREKIRSELPREDFLKSLGATIKFFDIDSESHPRFDRALELINKTNQFNSTGRRWSREELVQVVRDGGCVSSFSLSDKFSEYGLVGAAIIQGFCLSQIVMSCRVFGMEAEAAFLRHIAERRRAANHEYLIALFQKTDHNSVCASFLQSVGLIRGGEGGVPVECRLIPQAPNHIRQNSG